jgi:2'-5' RNA ligase
VRLFFALWPPRQAASALYEWAAQASRLSGGRVARRETIHLTLAFLGEVEEEKLPSVIRAGRGAGGQAHSLPIEQARHWSHNRIVWAGPNETPAALMALAGNLKRHLEREGLPLETRAFQAHITLVRKAREPRELPPLPAIEWPVGEFVLVRSALSREGSSYETIERFALDQK